MTKPDREEIIRMARGTCSQAPREDWESTAWVFGIEGLESFAALIAEAVREECAKMCEDVANARLVDAAPDLLDALLMVLDDPDPLDGRPRTFAAVCAAIAKATGERA
jgi:hypothetical protein